MLRRSSGRALLAEPALGEPLMALIVVTPVPFSTSRIGRLDIHVVMVEDVVKLAAELHGKPFRQLEVLHGHEINVPEAWRLKTVAPRQALTVLGIHATHSVQSAANRHRESVSVARRQAIRIQRELEVGKQVRRPRNWIASIGMSRSRNRGSGHVAWQVNPEEPVRLVQS